MLQRNINATCFHRSRNSVTKASVRRLNVGLKATAMNLYYSWCGNRK